MIRNETSIEQVVGEDYTTPTSLYDGKWTKTTQFMLPAVGINVKNQQVFRFFINAYLDDKGHEHEYKRPIFLLFGVENIKDFNWLKVYEGIRKSPNYITDYDCGMQNGKSLIMLVFSVPDEFEKDYYCFKKGRYSQFSTKYKDKFPQYIDVDPKNQKESIMWQVINLSETLRREVEKEFQLDPGECDSWLEIWDIPRKKREYYR